MGEIVGFSRLEILEEKGKKKKCEKASGALWRDGKNRMKKIYTGFAKDFTGSPSNSLPEIPFKMDEYFFLFLSFFPLFPFNYSTIFLVENKRTDIDGTQHRGGEMIHASLMEMKVSVTSVCSFEKLNRSTIVEGSVLTSTAIKISKKKVSN